MEQQLLENLKKWFDRAFGGIFKTDLYLNRSLGNGCKIVDGQCPFFRCYRIAQFWVKDNEIHLAIDTTMSNPDHLRHNRYPLVFNLISPQSIPNFIDTMIDGLLNYYKMLYREAIKQKRKHLKPLLTEMAQLFLQERKRCKSSDYDLL